MALSAVYSQSELDLTYLDLWFFAYDIVLALSGQSLELMVPPWNHEPAGHFPAVASRLGSDPEYAAMFTAHVVNMPPSEFNDVWQERVRGILLDRSQVVVGQDADWASPFNIPVRFAT